MKKKASSNSLPPTKEQYAYIQKFHEAVRLKIKGQTKEAIVKFEECLSVKPNDDAVHFALSELYLMDGNPQKSGIAIQKAAKLDPKNIHYTSELAYYYTEQGKFDLAALEFEKLIKSDPRNPEFLYSYAECLARAGKMEAAIAALNKTQDQLGIIPEISIQKYQLYRQLKQPTKAIEELTKARKNFPDDPLLLSTLVDYYLETGKNDQAITTLEDLAKTDELNGRVQLFLADMYRRKGDTDKFYQSAKKAFLGEGVDTDTKTQFLSSLDKGQKKIDPRAMELATIFTQTHPGDAKPYSILGDFYLSMGNDEEALTNYRKALQFEKSVSSLWKQVLLMEYQASKFEELAIDSKESIQYFPTMPSFYLLNGVANIQLKKYDEAIATLEVGREYITNDNATKAEFYGQLGEAYFGKKDYNKGNTWYTKALDTDPLSTLLLNNYAYRLAVSGQEIDKAESLIKQAIKRSPNQPTFIDTYGFVLFQKGKYAEAQKEFETAFGLDNQDKVAAEHLGDAYSKLGKKAEALKYWTKAKELGSTNKVLDKKIADQQYHEAEY